jgi:hypothetical protein
MHAQLELSPISISGFGQRVEQGEGVLKVGHSPPAVGALSGPRRRCDEVLDGALQIAASLEVQGEFGGDRSRWIDPFISDRIRWPQAISAPARQGPRPAHKPP